MVLTHVQLIMGDLGRALPDVSLVADPYQGYNLIMDGYIVNGWGGTSAISTYVGSFNCAA